MGKIDLSAVWLSPEAMATYNAAAQKIGEAAIALGLRPDEVGTEEAEIKDGKLVISVSLGRRGTVKFEIPRGQWGWLTPAN